MSGSLKVGGSELINDNGGSGALQWASGLPSGSIVQVQFHQFGGLGDDESGHMNSLSHDTNYVVQTSGNTSGGGQTGIVDVTITPKITGSKMWIQSQWFGELNADISHASMFFFWRSVGSTHTKLASGYTGGSPSAGQTGILSATKSYHESHVGSTPEACFLQYFDTHGISAGTSITYKLGFAANSSNISELFTNRTHGNDDEVGVSNLCVTELAP